MMKSWLKGCLCALVSALSGSAAFAQFCGPTSGPDVTVSSLTTPNAYGSVNGVAAFSIGTISCNIGTSNLLWIDDTNQHPVIAQNLYRLSNGRFEQIGMSWLKHGFAATNDNGCGCNCQSPGTFRRLGVGCSDPYDAGLNGTESGMGPRSEVNAHTGVFAYPFGTQGQSGNATYKRLQAAISDVDPALNPGALYYAEGHYVTQDDAASGNQNNNASYRECTTSFSSSAWRLTFSSTKPTVKQQSAIRVWKTVDPSVELTDVQVPDDGLIIVGAKVTQIDAGHWNYEYAVYNMNSDRNVGRFSIPLVSTNTVSDVGFHSVHSHSGEPYSIADWDSSSVGDEYMWFTDDFTTDANANAIRWGTLYNFRLTTNTPPVSGDVTIGLFKPGIPDTVTATTMVPSSSVPTIPGDITGDCVVDLSDLGIVLANFGTTSGATFETGDLDDDGDVDLSDLGIVLAVFGTHC